MGYHTPVYLVLFLPAAMAVYQLTAQKHRWKVLLFFSYLYFILISKELVLYQVWTVFVTYSVGRGLQWQEGKERAQEHPDKKKWKRRRRGILILGIFLVLIVLAWRKYYDFFFYNLYCLWGKGELFEAKKFLLPIGISFYTLEAIGYMADVYWKKVPAQNHPGHLALYLTFFPKLMEGPISSYKETIQGLVAGSRITGERLSQGLLRIFWGQFKKLVVADRLNTLVAEVFDYYGDYSGAIVAVAAVAYTIQLYMEFSGCMDIVIGTGRIFGVYLMENFRQPFFSKNASEFWRRWHISLGTWFKNYIFYPVSVSKAAMKWNRYSRKRFGKYISKIGTMAISLFPVWLCNGIWHGANWNYLFYGMYYFTIIMLGTILDPARKQVVKALHINEKARYWNVLRVLKTWVVIFSGELFFRAETLTDGLRMFASVFRNFGVVSLVDGTLLHLGLGEADFVAIAGGIVVVAAVDIYQEFCGDLQARIGSMKRPLRWCLYYALIFGVIIFGAYGAGYQPVDLIYAGF